ncbi:hypothetical protein Smp_197510 [Schistosoma mansoni]|nr:hypothetical protein Smp_197510 [Schistosoma mansoni]|eukprot:XP_018651283.1 hypothetical protein Smp_197510 [Schistosoma mansoni]
MLDDDKIYGWSSESTRIADKSMNDICSYYC